MGSFVESATLRVRDQSTKQLKKINAAILEVVANGKKLNNIKIRIAGLALTERLRAFEFHLHFRFDPNMPLKSILGSLAQYNKAFDRAAKAARTK